MVTGDSTLTPIQGGSSDTLMRNDVPDTHGDRALNVTPDNPSRIQVKPPQIHRQRYRAKILPQCYTAARGRSAHPNLV